MSSPQQSLFDWVGSPVDGPIPLVMIVDGWIEASEAMARVHETIVHQGDLETVAEFDTDRLVDHRARRPVVNIVDGVASPLHWPKLEISVGTDRNDSPFLYLHGPEPDFNWRPFATAAATALQTVGVSMMYTVAAYPVPAPHTRPIRISSVSTCPDLLVGRDFTSGTLTVPVGVQMAVSEELLASGVHTHGLYAQVPYYISTAPWPQASIDLLNGLAEISGLEFDTSMLEAQIPESRAAVEAILEDSPSLAAMVADLEQRFDDLQAIEEAEVPSGDQIERELQQFLRGIDDDGGGE